MVGDLFAHNFHGYALIIRDDGVFTDAAWASSAATLIIYAFSYREHLRVGALVYTAEPPRSLNRRVINK